VQPRETGHTMDGTAHEVEGRAWVTILPKKKNFSGNTWSTQKAQDEREGGYGRGGRGRKQSRSGDVGGEGCPPLILQVEQNQLKGDSQNRPPPRRGRGARNPKYEDTVGRKGGGGGIRRGGPDGTDAGEFVCTKKKKDNLKEARRLQGGGRGIWDSHRRLGEGGSHFQGEAPEKKKELSKFKWTKARGRLSGRGSGWGGG